VPGVRDSLQVVDTAILEREGRADDEVFYRGGDEDLAGSRQSRDASADRHGDSRESPTVRLNLAGVKPCPKLKPLPAHRLADRPSAAHGAGGAVEDSKEPVAQALDLTPAKPGELSARHMCVLLPNVTPTVVAHRRRLRGRVDDVGEQDRREDAMKVSCSSL
jgi:hypothetical protein